MDLVIDSRETKLLSFIQVPHKIESLPIGDILLESVDHRLLIERKTCEDLTASIKDGRYREQRSRLLSWKRENQKVMYVIEGCLKEGRLVLQRLMIAYDIPVWRTSGLEETRDYIEWIYKNGLDAFFKKREGEKDRIENIRFSAEQSKKKIITPKNLLISTLLSINGVSYEMAQSLSLPYRHIRGFVEGFDPSRSYDYKTSSGRTKKIGQTVVDRIFELFTAEPESSTPG